MKKKKWILIMMAGMVFSYTQATISNLNDGYVVQLEIVDHGHSGPDTPLTPVQPPQVSISGHTIYFTGTHNGFTLDLLDESSPTTPPSQAASPRSSCPTISQETTRCASP